MPSLDMNMNMNMSLPGIGPAGRWPRPRFNSDVAPRLADVLHPDTLVPPAAASPHYPLFHPFWDADLQSYMLLDTFLKSVGTNSSGNAVDWQQGYQSLAVTPVPTNTAFPTNTPPSDMTQTQLGAEVLRILELSLERDDRFAEILDQDDGAGAINYWMGMLKIDPSRHPGTNLMVHVGRRIGEHVSMCLKGFFRSPRPSQVAPSITPMIDPPATPSFPAGHAVQSYLISYMLAYSLADSSGNTNLPQHSLPSPTASMETFLATKPPSGPLFDLAARVSENRVVAGLHYPIDIRAGRAIATKIFQDIQGVPAIWGPGTGNLRGMVRGEFPQYAK